MCAICVCVLWSSDPEVGRDVLQLVQCLRLVSDAVSGEMAYEMEKALEHLQSPERAAELVLENMLSNDKSVASRLSVYFQYELTFWVSNQFIL